jgi:hypothetical protein
VPLDVEVTEQLASARAERRGIRRRSGDDRSRLMRAHRNARAADVK